MTLKHLRDPNVIREITASFQVGTMSVPDLANYYGASKTTIRKILAEAGLATYSAYKTKGESAILEYLKLHNITEVTQLKDRILTDASAKSLYNNMTIAKRVEWLNQSVQTGVFHEQFETVQHSKHI